MDFQATLVHQNLRLARNKIIVHVDAADPVAYPVRSGLSYSIDILLPTAYQSGVYEVAITKWGSERPASTIAGAPFYYGLDFDIADVIDSHLAYFRPPISLSGFQLAAETTIPFKTVVKTYNNGTLISTVSSGEETAIKSKLSVDQFAGWQTAFFTQYYDQKKPWLSWAPDTQTIDKNATTFAYFLVNFTPMPVGLTARLEVTFDNGTQTIVNGPVINTVVPNSVYALPVSLASLGISAYANTIEKLTIWLVNEASEIVSSFRNYIFNKAYQPNTRYIYFQNSLGGYDTLRVTGQSSQGLNISADLSERYLDANYLPSTSEIFVTGTTGEKTLNLNSGWVDEYGTEYLQELMFSEDIYILTAEGLVPIVRSANEYVAELDDEDLPFREFSFIFAKKETAFSSLGIAPSVPTRPTTWVASGPYCIIDPSTGFRTGYQGAASLKLVYSDNSQFVKGVPPKPNIPGTEGYFPPTISDSCPAGTAAFVNAEISALGTFIKSDCPSGYGDYATVVVSAGIYGGTSQAEADAKAQTAWNALNTQAYADANGSCLTGPESYIVSPLPAAGNFHFRYGTVGGTSSIQLGGGPGFFSGSPTEVVYGSFWGFGGNSNPSSITFNPGANDFKLPCSDGSAGYRVVFNASSAARRVRLYYNNVVQNDITYLANTDIRHPFPSEPPSQCMVYLKIENA
jgi:Family of unknown function (DUF5977)